MDKMLSLNEFTEGKEMWISAESFTEAFKLVLSRKGNKEHFKSTSEVGLNWPVN